MKPIQRILKWRCLRVPMLIVTIIFSCLLSNAATVSNLKATYSNGQVFLTWTNPTGSKMQYNVYRSTSKFTEGSQLTASKFMGFVRDNSAQNIQLSNELPGDVYYKIEDDGQPLTSGQGLYVITCTDNKPYFYAVTVSDLLTTIESKNITLGKNSLSSAVNEIVKKPKPVFQQRVDAGNEDKDYYTQFVNNQETELYPAMNSTGSYGFNFYVAKRGTATSYPLVVVYEGEGTKATSGVGLDKEITNCYVLGVCDWLPLPNTATGVGVGDNTYFAGYHENFNIYSNLNLIPLSGTVKLYCQTRYIEAIRWAKNTFPIDAAKVYTKGVSATGFGALLTGMLYPDEIAAVYASVEPMFVKPIGVKGALYEQMWGASITNLSTDIINPLSGDPLKVYEALDSRTMVNIQRNKSELPLIFDVHGKKDVTVTWSSKIISWYDSLESNRIGGVFYWDQRTHGGEGKDFLPEETTPDFFRYKTNKAYPAFSYCTINQDPGDGSPTSGDKYGAINGYLDWENNIKDNTCDFSVNVYIKDFYVGGVKDPDQYNTCKTDISLRRLQNFQPTAGQVIKWKNFDDSNSKIQSGSFTYNGGLLTLEGITVSKSGNRIEVNISNCDRIDEDTDTEVDAGESKITFMRASDGYTMKFISDEDGIAEIFMYDLMGRMIERRSITCFAGTNTIDIPSPGNGIFLLKVKGSSWIHSEKLFF